MCNSQRVCALSVDDKIQYHNIVHPCEILYTLGSYCTPLGVIVHPWELLYTLGSVSACLVYSPVMARLSWVQGSDWFCIYRPPFFNLTTCLWSVSDSLSAEIQSVSNGLTRHFVTIHKDSVAGMLTW